MIHLFSKFNVMQNQQSCLVLFVLSKLGTMLIWIAIATSINTPLPQDNICKVIHIGNSSLLNWTLGNLTIQCQQKMKTFHNLICYGRYSFLSSFTLGVTLHWCQILWWTKPKFKGISNWNLNFVSQKMMECDQHILRKLIS
jgi:hypothetical protein